QCGLPADLRDAGGPRLDGLVRGGQAAHHTGEPGRCARGGTAGGRARPADARAAHPVAGRPGGARTGGTVRWPPRPGRVPGSGAGTGAGPDRRPRTARGDRSRGRPAAVTPAGQGCTRSQDDARRSGVTNAGQAARAGATRRRRAVAFASRAAARPSAAPRATSDHITTGEPLASSAMSVSQTTGWAGSPATTQAVTATRSESPGCPCDGSP